MKMGIVCVTLNALCTCTDVVKAAQLSKKDDTAIINLYITAHKCNKQFCTCEICIVLCSSSVKINEDDYS